MKRQKMLQMKELMKSSEKELNKIKKKKNNIPDTEFKKMVRRMVNELSENFKECTSIRNVYSI